MTHPPTRFPPPTGLPVIAGPPSRQPASGRPGWAKPLLWVSLAVMAVGALGLMAAGADWAARTWEMHQLVSRIETSEAAMGVAQRAIGDVDLPADPTSAEKSQAQDELSAASAAGGAGVGEAGEEVGALTFLPWHDEQIAAQAAYLAHNQAWVDYLERGSTQPSTLFDADNMIEPTWVRAEAAVRAAAPTPTMPDLGQRIDDIFRDEESSEPPSGGLPA